MESSLNYISPGESACDKFSKQLCRGQLPNRGGGLQISLRFRVCRQVSASSIQYPLTLVIHAISVRYNDSFPLNPIGLAIKRRYLNLEGPHVTEVVFYCGRD